LTGSEIKPENSFDDLVFFYSLGENWIVCMDWILDQEFQVKLSKRCRNNSWLYVHWSTL